MHGKEWGMTEQIEMLDVESIHPDASNRNIGDVSELAASIKEQGVLQPVVVRPNATGFQLIIGERRWTAAKLAGLTEVPAIVREYSTEQAIEAQLVENLQRKDIEPLEEAQGYQRLVALDVAQKDIATKVGRSEAHVSKRLGLLELPERAQKMLSGGKLSLEEAFELRKLVDMPTRLAKVLDRAGSGYNAGLRYAIANEFAAHKKAEKVGGAKQKLKQAGVKIVGRPGWNSKTKQLGKGRDELAFTAKQHAAEPCHAAFVDDYPPHGTKYLCTDPTRHAEKGESELKAPKDSAAVASATAQVKETTADKRRREREEKERAAWDEETRRRRAFIVDLVQNLRGKKIPAVDAWQHVGIALIREGIHKHRELKAAAVALQVQTETEGRQTRVDEGDLLEFAGSSSMNLLRLNLAGALFAGENAVDNIASGHSWAGEPGDADWHLDFLTKHGYALSDLETKKLRAKA
jgi:ParB/RepB/Spo0J family partition protein